MTDRDRRRFTASGQIEAREATKTFGSGADATTALDRVSLEIESNEFFTLLGPSGCGKTTLLRLIAGFEQPTSGEILLDGQSLAGLPPYRRPVNTVFQSYALFPHMTVAENVAFGLEMQKRGKAEAERRVAEMLELVKLVAFARRRPQQLSGGQQQRVALARALANRPKVLLLDEPLSALDLKLRKEMQIELKRLQTETGITFVFVTHDQEEALTMSDRVAVMSEGRVLQVGTPSEIYEHPTRRFVADFIGETNFLSATLVGRANGRGRFRLAGGAEILAGGDGGHAEGEQVTLAVRPERARLADAGSRANGNARLSAVVETLVYFGTDTTCHLKLADGSAFKLRLQNRDGMTLPCSVGERIAVELAPEAIQVLVD
ncbi:MAG: ABC transporter ATP-binding protein [Kiloniellales bacterium]